MTVLSLIRAPPRWGYVVSPESCCVNPMSVKEAILTSYTIPKGNMYVQNL